MRFFIIIKIHNGKMEERTRKRERARWWWEREWALIVLNRSVKQNISTTTTQLQTNRRTAYLRCWLHNKTIQVKCVLVSCWVRGGWMGFGGLAIAAIGCKTLLRKWKQKILLIKQDIVTKCYERAFLSLSLLLSRPMDD